MLTAVRARQEIDDYRRRVDALYGEIGAWIGDRIPGSTFHRTRVQLNEAATGPYELESLDVGLPGLPAVRFVPRGIFTVGARPRRRPQPPRASVISRSFFPNAAEGWSWSDPKRTELRPLTADVLWDHVLTPLTR